MPQGENVPGFVIGVDDRGDDNRWKAIEDYAKRVSNRGIPDKIYEDIAPDVIQDVQEIQAARMEDPTYAWLAPITETQETVREIMAAIRDVWGGRKVVPMPNKTMWATWSVRDRGLYLSYIGQPDFPISPEPPWRALTVYGGWVPPEVRAQNEETMERLSVKVAEWERLDREATMLTQINPADIWWGEVDIEWMAYAATWREGAWTGAWWFDPEGDPSHPIRESRHEMPHPWMVGEAAQKNRLLNERVQDLNLIISKLHRQLKSQAWKGVTPEELPDPEDVVMWRTTRIEEPVCCDSLNYNAQYWIDRGVYVGWMEVPESYVLSR